MKRITRILTNLIKKNTEIGVIRDKISTFAPDIKLFDYGIQV